MSQQKMELTENNASPVSNRREDVMLFANRTVSVRKERKGLKDVRAPFRP